MPGPAIDELPDEDVEQALASPQFQEPVCIVDRGLDLQPLADDAGVAEQGVDPAPCVASNPLRIELIEGPAVVHALVQRRRPAESCLAGIQYQVHEMPGVVVQRDAPLGVVVGDHQGTGLDLAGPLATREVGGERRG